MMEIGERVRKLRNEKGYSRDELAEASGLSVHTIQRIENGETKPRGDTLWRLAETLEVTEEELLGRSLRDDRTFLSAMNLSALLFLLFPLLGMIIPFVMWISRRHQIEGVDRAGAALINFQITWNLAFFAGLFVYIIWFSNYISALGEASPGIMREAAMPLYWLFGILYLYNLLLIIFNALRSGMGRSVWYHPRIRIIR